MGFTLGMQDWHGILESIDVSHNTKRPQVENSHSCFSEANVTNTHSIFVRDKKLPENRNKVTFLWLNKNIYKKLTANLIVSSDTLSALPTRARMRQG